MGVINRKERFATEGIRFQRLNADRTIPTPQRFLGFTDTVDISGALDSSFLGDITIKIDHGVKETKTVDFTDVADKTAVPVATAVTKLNLAGFTGITWSQDAKTGRLMGAAAGNGKIIQVYGKLAGALDFGQCAYHGGYGLQIISFFDDETISIGLAKNIKEKEEIDIEGAKGTLTRMVIGSMLQGVSPVITLRQKDYELLELIQGGWLNREAGTYDPPLSNDSEHPSFWGEIFSPVYSTGSNKMSDVAGYERILLRSMLGTEGDVPIEAKAWTQYAFNLEATEYFDETGAKFASYQEQTLTPEEFEALRVKELRVD
jgi:hypothetical protein